MSDSLEETKRLQYLQAMDIDVWTPRHQIPGRWETEQKIQRQDADIATMNNDADSVWEQLRQQVADCQQCLLYQGRTQTVFGVGNRNADWMLIGEAPGKQEDLKGEPFVGPAGQLLTEMIRALGYARDEVYIANILKCRPPNNRDPKIEEVEACSGFLKQQIALVKPKIILAVGRIAAQRLLGTQESLAKLRGVVHKLDDIPVVVVYHPAYLLRSLLEKRKAWQDLQLARQVYQNL